VIHKKQKRDKPTQNRWPKSDTKPLPLTAHGASIGFDVPNAVNVITTTHKAMIKNEAEYPAHWDILFVFIQGFFGGIGVRIPALESVFSISPDQVQRPV
jgi:hypothetical protein